MLILALEFGRELVDIDTYCGAYSDAGNFQLGQLVKVCILFLHNCLVSQVRHCHLSGAECISSHWLSQLMQIPHLVVGALVFCFSSSASFQCMPVQ